MATVGFLHRVVQLLLPYQLSPTTKGEVNELWNMIGETDERAKVHKLWSGLRKELQRDLWREKLNPEVSSLKKVAATAEILEIAQTVTLKVQLCLMKRPVPAEIGGSAVSAGGTSEVTTIKGTMLREAPRS